MTVFDCILNVKRWQFFHHYCAGLRQTAVQHKDNLRKSELLSSWLDMFYHYLAYMDVRAYLNFILKLNVKRGIVKSWLQQFVALSSDVSVDESRWNYCLSLLRVQTSPCSHVVFLWFLTILSFCVRKNFWSIFLMLYFQILSNCCLPFLSSAVFSALCSLLTLFPFHLMTWHYLCSTQRLHSQADPCKKIQKMVNSLLNQDLAMCALFKLQSLSAKAML